MFPWFLENDIIHRLGKIFPRVIVQGFLWPSTQSLYGFNQTLELNLIILCPICNTNQWFSVWFKCVMCIVYFVYHKSITQVFHTFQPSFLLEKMINLCIVLVIFKDIKHQLQRTELLQPWAKLENSHCMPSWTFWWIRNSSDHRRVWTAHFLHVL